MCYFFTTTQLSGLELNSGSSGTLLGKSYIYDYKGNVSQVSNSVGSTFGAEYSGIFPYDGLNISECHDSCQEEEGNGSPYPRNACACSNNLFYAEQELDIDCNLSRILYCYHPDYLGHNEYITDITGRPYRYFHYSAFGESLIEKNTNYGQFSSPYRFNGKELDPETGNYYYGARYYNPVWGIWLGVDPLAEKYPHMSSYVFTGNNPLIFIDPNGDSLDVANLAGFNDVQSLANSSNQHRISQDANGRISVDISGLSQEALRADKGLALVYDMSVASEKILFSSGEFELFSDGNGGQNLMTVGYDRNGVINASRKGKDSNGKNTILPQEGYSSQVAITSQGFWDMNGGGRRSIVFHELAETYYRAQGIDFGNHRDPNDNGAHNRASRLEGGHYGNRTPGAIIKYHKPEYSVEQKKAYSEIVRYYYNLKNK